MPSSASGTRECPFCKEEIKAEAVKCKHCKSRVDPERPAHGGTCPFCKEDIKPEAVKCKHCGSMVVQSAKSGCCQGCDESSNLHHVAMGTSGLDDQPQIFSQAMAPAHCTECVRVKFGRGSISVRTCCKKVWIPFLGIVDACWIEPCFGLPDGPILA